MLALKIYTVQCYGVSTFAFFKISISRVKTVTVLYCPYITFTLTVACPTPISPGTRPDS